MNQGGSIGAVVWTAVDLSRSHRVQYDIYRSLIRGHAVRRCNLADSNGVSLVRQPVRASQASSSPEKASDLLHKCAERVRTSAVISSASAYYRQ